MSASTVASGPTTFLKLNTEAPSFKWWIAVIVLVAGATQTFAGTSVNLVIPRLMAAFGTDLAQTQWVATYPVVNLRLFRLPAFSLICTTAFLNNVGLFGALFMVPIFLQRVLDLTPMQAGLVIVPGLIGMAFSGVIAGRLSDLLAPPIVVGTMMLALSVIFFSFSSVTATTAITVIVFYVVLYRMCMIGVVTPMTLLLVQHINPDQVRMGQGLLGVVRSIGGVLGVTVTSVFFDRRSGGAGYHSSTDGYRSHYGGVSR